MQNIDVAVIGTGHLGKFHAKAYSNIEGAKLRYVVDPIVERAQAVSKEFGGEAVPDFKGILDKVQAVSIVTPTTLHHQVAKQFLDKGINVLLEKPMTVTVAEADELINIAKKNKATLQIGHIERFNPAYLAAKEYIKDPLFIEAHRLGPYSFRSCDVSVVLDLMIHDLDLVLDIVGGKAPKSVEAFGTPIVSPTADVVNATIKFDTCTANITTSRVSTQRVRRIRVFQRDSYVCIDFLEKKAYYFKKKAGFDLKAAAAECATVPPDQLLGKLVDMKTIEPQPSDALRSELSSFLEAVRAKKEPVVTGTHGRRALAVAAEVDREILKMQSR